VTGAFGVATCAGTAYMQMENCLFGLRRNSDEFPPCRFEDAQLSN
jgi:hypothetical protein